MAAHADYPPVTRHVAGVFKGGGARGVVYAGALREVRARGIWFRTVAGSSAGAITAALVAIGTHPDDLADAADEALRQVPSNWLRGFLPNVSRSCYRTDRLRSWLEDRLRLAVGDAVAGDVTFADLAAASDVELNVVAMDLHRMQPIVFNALRTPYCSVSAAVVASCAIPVAMPAGRVLVPSAPGGPPEVHRLVDGGAWANYPAFVYTDASFREYHDLPPLPPDVVTLGFVIDSEEAPSADAPPPCAPPPPDPAAVRSAVGKPSPFDRGSASRTGTFGALLSWTALRWAAAIAVPAVASVLMLWWLADQGRNGFADWEGVRPVYGVPVLLAAALVVVATIYVAITVTLVQARFAYEGIDVGLPSLKAALSVSTGVPDWVGHSADDRVVRLWSPTGIQTTSFRVAAAVRERAIRAAEVTADAQLATLFPEPRADVPRTAVSPAPPAAPALTRPARAGLWLAALAGAVLLAFRTDDPALVLAVFVLGPALGTLPWVLRAGRRAPDDGPSEALSRLSIALRVLGLGVLVWAEVAAIATGTGEGLVVVLVLYVAVVPLTLSLARALLQRRQVAQGLLEGGAAAKGVVAQAAFGVVVAVAATWALAWTSESQAGPLPDVGIVSALWWPMLAACVAAAGVGTTVAALARARAARHYARYAAEVGRNR